MSIYELFNSSFLALCLCCAIYSSLGFFLTLLFLSLSFFLLSFRSFILSFPPPLAFSHMYDCTHAIAYMFTIYTSFGLVFLLYQFGQVEIRDNEDIVIILPLTEQFKIHAYTRRLLYLYLVHSISIIFCSLLRIRIFSRSLRSEIDL